MPQTGLPHFCKNTPVSSISLRLLRPHSGGGEGDICVRVIDVGS